MIRNLFRALALLAALPCLSPLARAGGQTPASFLLYPQYDTRAAQMTFLTLTNVNDDPQTGAVDVHLVYVNSSSCLQSDFLVHLTARDTVTILAGAQVPAGQQGYVWAVALDPVTHRAVRFDYLVGALLCVDGTTGQDWTVQPLGFLGKTPPGADTDVNHNGKPDLDGVEYERAPNRFYVPRFFGQSPEPAPRMGTISDLILLQPLVGTGVTTTTAFLIFNDNEEVFSGAYAFTCWKRVRLSTISGVFTQPFLAQSNQNPLEIVGAPSIEAGWFQVRGVTATGQGGQQTQNPPVLGVLVEMRVDSAADLPFLESN